MLLSYITTESNGTLTLDQLLRGPLSLSAREVREAKRLGLTVDGAPFFANQRIGAGRTVAIPLAEYDMPTDFSAPAEVDILYQDDAVLDAYLALKAEEKEYIAAGTYTEEVQVDLATRYGKLMGYSDEHIAESIGA